jgi:hypothetical protein
MNAIDRKVLVYRSASMILFKPAVADVLSDTAE